MRTLLLQLDTSRHPSVFDRVVAFDGGADEVMSYGGVTTDTVRDLVHGAIFTRGPKDLHQTAIFIGGTDIVAGEQLLTAVRAAFFGPLRVSVMLDSNGSNTTAVAAVVKLEQAAGDVRGRRAVVTAATGPVGMRAAGLLAQAGAEVTGTSRRIEHATQAAERIQQRFGAAIRPLTMMDASQAAPVLEGTEILLNAAGAGIRMIPREAWAGRAGLRAAADINAVPPLGIEGIEMNDDGVARDNVVTFGALGVGNLKMKIHKACIARLFERNDLVLDAETIAEVARKLTQSPGNVMPRVIGFDPGTVTLDLCGLDDGRVFLDESFPTADALAHPETIAALIIDSHRAAPLDLIAGPSGYGLPLISARDVTDADLALACLAAKGETGGIRGLRSFMRMLADVPAPVIFTPGVVHLQSVPAHRKVNRVDMGTADKVCAAALGIHEQAIRRTCDEQDASFILLELGGAFTAAIAVERGRIVDGVGGTSGPLGLRAVGALDGEVAYLAGSVAKQLLSTGGVASIGGSLDSQAEALVAPTNAQGRMAWEAYIESAVKAVASMTVSVPRAREVLLSGRLARISSVREEFVRRLTAVIPGAPAHNLIGFAPVAKQAAQGAALIADGLAGGRATSLVNALGIRESTGTVLDYLYVISAAEARVRLGLG